jgi:hypothetical protein
MSGLLMVLLGSVCTREAACALERVECALGRSRPLKVPACLCMFVCVCVFATQ